MDKILDKKSDNELLKHKNNFFLSKLMNYENLEVKYDNSRVKI